MLDLIWTPYYLFSCLLNDHIGYYYVDYWAYDDYHILSTQSNFLIFIYKATPTHIYHSDVGVRLRQVIELGTSTSLYGEM